MFLRLLIPLIAVLLFLFEPELAFYSPIKWDDATLYLIPRFVIIYLIFISIYYVKNRAILYAFLFGLLYDVFYIDIIGLYTVLYPAVCVIAAWSVKRVQPNLIVAMALSIFLMAIMEFVLYGFFYLINFTEMGMMLFITSRLIPTIVANLLFIVMLGWAFKYLLDQRVLQRENSHS